MISIIVPLYNCQDYIEKCLVSIINQSYKNIEVIIINDGSTDDSLLKINKIVQEDTRIRVITRDNGGLSAARNAGIEQSTGDYLMFVDADDELLEDAIEKLYNAILKNEADAAVGSISVVYETHSELQESDKYYYTVRYQGAKIANDTLINDFHCSSCAVLFKKNIIEKNQLRFPVGLVYEDAFWHWIYFTLCKTIAFVKEPVYRYYRHKKSIMSSTFEQAEGIAIQHIYIVEQIFDFWAQRNELSSRYKTALILLESFFWLAFKYSKKYEKAKAIYECAKVAQKYSLPVEKNKILYQIVNGNLGFLFLDTENQTQENIGDYIRFLKIKSLVDRILPYGTLRRKWLYNFSKFCYSHLIKH